MVAAMLASLILVLQQTPTYDELFPKGPPPEVISVHKVSESTTTIKPCQPLTVVFEVTLAEKALRTQWPKVAKQASKLVRINKTDHVNLNSDSTSLNNACKFELLWPVSPGGEPPLPSAQTSLISAVCQMDIKARECLFLDPGEYRFEFFFGDQTLESTVQVKEPTIAERQVITMLNTLPMLLFLYDPTDRQYATLQNIQELEKFLDKPSGYSEMLRLSVGVAKSLRVGLPPFGELTDEQKKAELSEQLNLLAPALDLEPNTRLAGLAYFQLTNAASQLARLEQDEPRRADLKRIAEKAMEKLEKCPLVPQQQGMAKGRN